METILIPQAQNCISAGAFDRVLHSFHESYLNNFEYDKLQNLFANFEKTWIAKTGNFTKRFAKLIHKNLDVSLDAPALNFVGTEFGRYFLQNKYQFEIKKSFDWAAGAFGDEGSCFFSEQSNRKFVLNTLRENDFYSYNFYKSTNGNLKGIARCIAKKNNKGEILFNSYGYTLLESARVIAHYKNLLYKQIKLKNNGEDSGDLFINNGSGYLLTTDLNTSIDSYDFEIDIERKEVCCNCDDIINEDDICRYEDDTYCWSCFNERFIHCEHCNDIVTNDDANYLEHYEISVCESCLENKYIYCDCCNEYTRFQR